MRKFLTVAAIILLRLPAQTAFANRDNQPPPPRNDTRNVETPDRKTLTVRGGGLLNTETTPEQAKKIAEATNRQILEKRRKR